MCLWGFNIYHRRAMRNDGQLRCHHLGRVYEANAKLQIALCISERFVGHFMLRQKMKTGRQRGRCRHLLKLARSSAVTSLTVRAVARSNVAIRFAASQLQLWSHSWFGSWSTLARSSCAKSIRTCPVSARRRFELLPRCSWQHCIRFTLRVRQKPAA
jgi:hypothetical protein